jgi:hypothetical protein
MNIPENFNLPDGCEESDIDPPSEREESLYLDENEPREDFGANDTQEKSDSTIEQPTSDGISNAHVNPTMAAVLGSSISAMDKARANEAQLNSQIDAQTDARRKFVEGEL